MTVITESIAITTGWEFLYKQRGCGFESHFLLKSRLFRGTSSFTFRRFSSEYSLDRRIWNYKYKNNVNPFVPNASFLYPLETLKNLMVFCYKRAQRAHCEQWLHFELQSSICQWASRLNIDNGSPFFISKKTAWVLLILFENLVKLKNT